MRLLTDAPGFAQHLVKSGSKSGVPCLVNPPRLSALEKFFPSSVCEYPPQTSNVECKYNQPPFYLKDARRLRDRIFGPMLSQNGFPVTVRVLRPTLDEVLNGRETVQVSR
jgi:hypothetical protein